MTKSVDPFDAADYQPWLVHGERGTIMSGGKGERVAAFEARHAAIIARTLQWADDEAARCDYARALHWVETVCGLGHELPEEYAAKRETWRNAIDSDGRTRGQT